MKVFLLKDFPDKQGFVRIEGEDFHYLCHVRRLKKNHSLKVRDPHGQEWKASVQELHVDYCLLKLSKEGDQDKLNSSVEIHLFICLPKGKKMDLMVRQAGETGVRRIYPILSRHSMVKLHSIKEKQAKQERWQKILREAIQQSGSSIESRLELPRNFSDIESIAEGPVFFLHQDRLQPFSIGEQLQDFSSHYIGIIIGPEGGFSSEEVQTMLNWGFNPVYLGANVLRAETASLYGVAAIKTFLEFRNVFE